MTTDDTKPAQRRGRPRLAEEDRKSSQIKLRARAGLREQLEEAAAQSGRSVSEEAEKRLENSFQQEDLIKAATEAATNAAVAASTRIFDHLFYNRDINEFCQSIASALHYAMEQRGLENVSYSDIKNNPEDMKFVENYLKDFITYELNRPKSHRSNISLNEGIKANIAAEKRGDVWPKSIK